MINIHHIKYFYDSLQLGSLTASAKANRVTLSAVSQAIAGLEEAMGTPLLVHGKNRLVATPQGRLLCERCSDVFVSIERMFLEVAEADAGEAGQIRFAASHSLCNTVLPGFLQSYLARCPKVELSLLTGDAIKVRELILARKIDVGLAVETRTGGPRNRSALASGAFVFACHRDHIDKSNDVLVLGDKGEEVLALREALRGRKALSKIRLMHTQSWEVITSLAAAGVGVGYVPDFLVDEKKGLQAIDLGVPRSLYDIVPHGADTLAHSRTIRRFMDEMSAYFKKGI